MNNVKNIEALTAIVIALIGSQWFWQFLSNRFSKTSNKLIIQSVEALKSSVNDLNEKIDKNKADSSRERIIHFNSEILRDMNHSKEEYTDVLATIDNYEDYCKRHTEYLNNRAVLAIENIKHEYKKCLKNHNFLRKE